MENILVNKETVLEKLRDNRSRHTAVFEEALKGYRSQAIEALEQHIKLIKEGKVTQVYVSIPTPVNHTKDYDRAITMLEMAIGDQVTLSEDDVEKYILDNWTWKQQFLASNSLYSATAAAQLNG